MRHKIRKTMHGGMSGVPGRLRKRRNSGRGEAAVLGTARRQKTEQKTGERGKCTRRDDAEVKIR